MSWYTVSILFRANCSSQSTNPTLWEERLLLIEAASADDAEREGTTIGKRGDHEYEVGSRCTGEAKQKLKWTFDRIERVFLVEDDRLSHGTELFSRYLRDSEVKSLLTPFEDE